MDPNLGNAVSQNIAMAMQGIGGSPGVNAGTNLAERMIGQEGMNPGTLTAAQGLGQTANQYGNIWNTSQGTQNPYLEAILNTNNRRIGDRINSSMSGAGRYGSAQHTDVMARALAESANPILAQDYANRQQLGLQATQGYGQTMGALGDVYGQGLQRAGQWSQLAPTLDQARYANVDRLQGVGQFLTNRNQLGLQDEIKRYEAQQAYPWEQLARQAAIMGGAGQLGGTKTTVSNPYQPSMLQRGFGGAVAGAGVGSIFGLPGAGIGAVGGGLLGLLS